MSTALVIASYNGPRRWSMSNGDVLRFQYEQLQRLSHCVDDVIVVQNEYKEVPKELELFDHVIHRHNRGGSYAAWIEAYRQNPQHDWYIFIEDDYVFVRHNFDRAMIDLWDDGISYLCCKLSPPLDRFGVHMGMSSGLTHRDVLKHLNSNFPVYLNYEEAYDVRLQLGFSKVFEMIEGKRIEQIYPKYVMPYWQEELLFNEPGPLLLVPIQMTYDHPEEMLFGEVA